MRQPCTRRQARSARHLYQHPSTTGKKARTAFDGPGTTSTVTLAVKPRQRYVRGHGITVTNSATSRGDAEKRFGMRWSRI